MMKKILFAFGVIITGIFVYYISWINAFTEKMINSSASAITSDNLEFFLKYSKYYDDEPLLDETSGTVRLRVYNACFDKSETETNLNALYFIITGLPSDINYDSSSAEANSKLVIKEGSKEYTISFSTYSYSKISIITLYAYYNSALYPNLEVTAGSKITDIDKLTIKDAKDVEIFTTNPSETNILTLEDNLIENWPTVGHVGYTETELQAMMPSLGEMGNLWISLAIWALIMTGFGLFFFWPRKPKMVDVDTEQFKKKDENKSISL